ncbi:hypothetical protein [Flavobacterium chilense]|uniref:Uncharacterized protein n=1 Tax=Flavobacterium chilense TaxID=946677 RepID=A0A1M7F2T2_9FLAO|nr:hypothetical protein [Flavobacterium chilense]SHL98018.1 hypothetical protein SAMN05444484_103187 [Flavobacterium chilense]
MADLSKITDFKTELINCLLAYLAPIGYKYNKSKEMFSMSEEEYNYKIFVYTNKRSRTIAVETKGYISFNKLDKKFKNNSITNLDIGLCGGGGKAICEKYFKQKYWNEYPEMQFYFEGVDKIDKIIDAWKSDFEQYYVPFFNECKSPFQINEIVNGNIEEVGLCHTFKAKVMYSLDIAKMASVSNSDLLKLVSQYENYLKNKFDDGGRLLNAFLANKELFFK